MQLKRLSFLLLFICGYLACVQSQTTVLNPQTDKKLLKQFQDAKLGLFIHWMACHSPGTGDSWAIGNGTPKSVADSITMKWNPQNFNPKEIVNVAVQAGCKYMVVISKHHDGFCIWPSEYSIFDIDRIPFKRDILKELGEECRKQGLLYGIYYSIADIDYCGWNSMAQVGREIKEPKYGREDFIRFVHNQTKELIDRYQPDILWFDGFWLDPLWTAKEGNDLYQYIKKLKSNTLSTRLAITRGEDGHETFWTDGSSGDYFSIEAKTTDAPPFPWEACTSVTYPVYAYEPDAKMLTADELIGMFSKTLCGNGNLLVNIGPKPTGEMPEEQVERLYELTKWINRNREAVYDTHGGPFKQTDEIGSTYKDEYIYLHLRKPVSTLRINSLEGYQITKAFDLSTGKRIKIQRKNNEVILSLPAWEKGRQIPVIALKLDREYRFVKWLPFVLLK
jgi:hypothetical protein